MNVKETTAKNLLTYLQHARPLRICCDLWTAGGGGYYELDLAPLVWIMRGCEFMPDKVFSLLIKVADHAAARKEFDV